MLLPKPMKNLFRTFFHTTSFRAGTPALLLLVSLLLTSCGPVGDIADKMLFGITEYFEANRGPLGARIWPDGDGNDTADDNECNYAIAENGPAGVFKIVLTRAPTADVKIPVSVAPEGIAAADKSQVVFTSSDWDQPQTITVTPGTDVGANTLISLKFLPAQSEDNEYNLFTVPEVKGIVILDNDLPSIVVTSNINARTDKKIETSEDLKKGCASVVLTKAPTADVTIGVSSSRTTEGTVSLGSMTFTVGNWSTGQTVLLTGVDDSLIDGDINYNLHFNPISSTDGDYSSKQPFTNQANGLSNDVAAYNLDNDTPAVQVTPTTRSINEGAAVGAANRFSVKLLKGPANTVTIPVSIDTMPTTDGVDRATIDTTLLTFTPGDCPSVGNWCTAQEVTITPNNNNVADGDINFKVVLGQTTNYGNINPPDVDVSLVDDDEPKILIKDPDRNVVENDSVNLSKIEIVLNTKPTNDVTIVLNAVHLGGSATKPVDRLGGIRLQGSGNTPANTTTVTFTPANWNTKQYVEYVPENDDIADGLIQFLIGVSAGTSSDPNYNNRQPVKAGVAAEYLTLNYNDDDVPGLIIVAQNKNDCATNTYQTGGSTVTITGFATDDSAQLDSSCYSQWTMALRSKPLGTINVSLGLTTNPNQDGTLNTSSLTFTPSDWNTPQSVTVTGHSDGTNEGNHDYTVSVTGISGDGTYADGQEKYNMTNKVAYPKFTIFSCDNDVNNSIASCRRSGGFGTSEGGGTATLWWIGKTNTGTCTASVYSDDESEGKVTFAGGGVSGSPATGTVNLSSSNWNTMNASGANRIVVTGQDDAFFDGNILYHLIVSTTCGSLHSSAQSVSLRNTDNEQALVVCDAGGANATRNSSESGTTGKFGLKMAGAAPSSDVTFSISCAGGSTECNSVSPSTVTISTSNACVPITVNPKTDNRADGTQSVCVSFGAIVSDDLYYNEIVPPGVCPINNEDKDKVVFITDGATPAQYAFNPNFNVGMSQADAYCNVTDNGKPSWGTYKALLADSGTRVATTSGTDATGAVGWILQPSTNYYRKDIGGGAGPYTTKVFTTSADGLITSFNAPFTANASVTYWTGLKSNMTTADNTCLGWTGNNTGGPPYETTFGQGNSTTLGNALSAGISDCDGMTTRRLICVQQ